MAAEVSPLPTLPDKGIISQMIDLTGNPGGMYNLQIENDAGIANKKIVIQ